MSELSGPDQHNEGVRLQKLLSKAGVASRRAAEDMITAGRVTINGEVVRTLGTRVDPETTAIHVDGDRITVNEDLQYLVFNKPRGVHTTMSEDKGRPCVGDYIPKRAQGVFHIGRLDAETEGLLLLTNDGELAHRLMHPSYEVFKTYLAEVPGPIPRDLGKRLRSGIELSDGLTRVRSFRLVDDFGKRALVQVVVHEGRKHIVRRLLKQAGHPVQRLVRVEMGGVRLGNMRPGSIRPLDGKEQAALFRVAQM